jgi:transcriptional antiterminator NusG
MYMSKPEQVSIYAVKTTSGRELDVAFILERRVLELVNKGQNVGVRSILIPPGIRGYVFVEAENPTLLYSLLSNIKYASTQKILKVPLSDMLSVMKPREVVEEINVGDIVEIVRGPFRGMKARVVSIDKSKNTLTVNLLEATFSIPVTIPISYVKKGG